MARHSCAAAPPVPVEHFRGLRAVPAPLVSGIPASAPPRSPMPWPRSVARSAPHRSRSFSPPSGGGRSTTRRKSQVLLSFEVLVQPGQPVIETQCRYKNKMFQRRRHVHWIRAEAVERHDRGPPPPSQQPAACPPGPPSAGSSRSPWRSRQRPKLGHLVQVLDPVEANTLRCRNHRRIPLLIGDDVGTKGA